MTVFVGRDTLIAVQLTGIEGADEVWVACWTAHRSVYSQITT